jgi:hypothetical protein
MIEKVCRRRKLPASRRSRSILNYRQSWYPSTLGRFGPLDIRISAYAERVLAAVGQCLDEYLDRPGAEARRLRADPERQARREHIIARQPGGSDDPEKLAAASLR